MAVRRLSDLININTLRTTGLIDDDLFEISLIDIPNSGNISSAKITYADLKAAILADIEYASQADANAGNSTTKILTPAYIPHASETVFGGIKTFLDDTDLYITIDAEYAE